MSWTSALRKQKADIGIPMSGTFCRPNIPQHTPDWARLVSLDFETYWDTEYTLKKMSTSEYVRDPRFKVQMMGIKIGNGKTRIVPHARVAAELRKINWSTHALLCHNTQFDGFVLSHHFGVQPAFVYDSLAMARGLHSNDIGAGLDEVSIYYGGQGKTEGGLDGTQGVLNWPKPLFDQVATYCINDVEEMLRVFKLMLPKMPADEIDLINIITKMFTDPVLKVDLPRVEAELKRELDRREGLMYAAVNPADWEDKGLLKGKEKLLVGKERDILLIKRVIGSNDRFADLLRAEDVEPPVKLSVAWMKLNAAEREAQADRKWTYAFAKDDAEFINLPNMVESWGFDLNDPDQVKLMVAKQERLQALVDVRLAVKSTTNVTRAERFLTAGANGMPLPVGYAYYRAHTGRLGGNNKMNMQNLTRGGELRLSILAPKGHALCVQDSGQIEARVNGWLWSQNDLLDAFRAADTGTGRDAYCNFADLVYNREITKADKMERFVGKVCLAEGELVLTNRGLVPINLISKEDRLWDGVEWVTHDGVIDQGIREVITYDGLTATPDHEVFTEDGRIIPLGQAASEMARLQNTGVEGQSIRFCDDHVVADTPRKRLSVRVGALQPKRDQEADLSQQPEKRQDDLVPQERAQASTTCGSSGQTLRRDPGQMQQPSTQTLEELRWAGDQVPVQDQDGVHRMGCSEPAPQGLQERGDRQEEQRRELRAGQFKAGDQDAAESEQAQYRENHVVGQASAAERIPEPIQPPTDLPIYEGGVQWRTDSATGAGEGSPEVQELAGHPRQVRCYDITNAGPRKRFTVSGKLVLNCVLGLGFQMGPAKLQITLAKGALGGPPVYFTLDQCKVIINTYRIKNNQIKNGWEVCKGIIEDMAAGREGNWGPLHWEANTIWLPNGMTLKYPDLRVAKDENGWDAWTYQAGDQRKKIYGGLLCENIVQALARIIVLGQTLAISRKYRIVMSTHDEAVALAPLKKADACIKFMEKCMRTAPDWCKDIPLNCEGGFAVNYSK
jgi:DNA polymerase